jgi:hypothetical protein
MSNRLERFGLLAGGLAGVLWVVGVFVLEGAGNPADPAGGEVVADFYRDDRVAILVASTLHGLGGVLFLYFVAAVRSALQTSGVPQLLTNAVVVGGTAGGALMLLLTGGHTTGATTDKELLSPEVAILFWRLAHGFFVGAELALAVFLGALSVVALRRLVLPRWLGWFGLVVTILLLIPPLGWIGVLFLLPIWLLIASVLLFRASSPSTAALAAP